MTQLFRRKPIAELLAEGDHSLKRVMGAGDLIMLAIGAVVSLTLTVIGWIFVKPVFDRPAEKKEAGVLRDVNAATPKHSGIAAGKVASEAAQPPVGKAAPEGSEKAEVSHPRLTPDSH